MHSPARVGGPPTFVIAMGLIVAVALGGVVVPYARDARTSARVASITETTIGAHPGSGSDGSATPGADIVPGTTAGTASTVPGSKTTDRGGITVPPTSGRGVTDDEVFLGIAIIDAGAATSLGFNFDLGDQRARYQALIDDRNEKGGINGRRIVPHYRVFNAIDPAASAQAACVAWTKDIGVFSVLVASYLPVAAAMCVVGEGGTPLVTGEGVDDSYYANGLYFSTQASDTRVLVDQVDYLESEGRLAGRTIGVLAGDGPERVAVDRALVPAIERLGYEVATVETVPPSTVGTQRLPIAISNLKAAGVDLVIVAASVIAAGPFAQAADRAGYRPELALSDFNGEINDQVAGYYPDSFDGTVGLLSRRFPEYRAGAPFAPADQACLDRVHPVDPKVLPVSHAAFEVAMGECAAFDAWAAGALRAGRGLHRASFVAGMEQSGSFGSAGSLDGSFGPGKHDAVDFVREVAWHRSCTCWELVGGRSAPVRRMGGGP
jgi:ABC-type branched-subunit amino acid transport system substrate-binding protein